MAATVPRQSTHDMSRRRLKVIASRAAADRSRGRSCGLASEATAVKLELKPLTVAEGPSSEKMALSFVGSASCRSTKNQFATSSTSFLDSPWRAMTSGLARRRTLASKSVNGVRATFNSWKKSHSGPWVDQWLNHDAAMMANTVSASATWIFRCSLTIRQERNGSATQTTSANSTLRTRQPRNARTQDAAKQKVHSL